MKNNEPEKVEEEHLKSRLVAMLMGEVGPEEEETLRRHLAERADLRKFLAQTRGTIEHLQETMGAHTEGVGGEESVRLSPERRKKLQAVLDGPAETAGKPAPLLPLWVPLAAAMMMAVGVVLWWAQPQERQRLSSTEGREMAEQWDDDKEVSMERELEEFAGVEVAEVLPEADVGLDYLRVDPIHDVPLPEISDHAPAVAPDEREIRRRAEASSREGAAAFRQASPPGDPFAPPAMSPAEEVAEISEKFMPPAPRAPRTRAYRYRGEVPGEDVLAGEAWASVTIPEANFSGVPLAEVLEELESQLREHGGEEVSVPSLAVDPRFEEIGDREVYVSLRNLNAGRVLHYVAEQTEVGMVEEDDKFLFRPQRIERRSGLLEASAEPRPEVLTSENPFSTFSLAISDASFRLVRGYLGRGEWPPEGVIRPEEFLNAIDYRDPLPVEGGAVAFHWEQGRVPFLHNRDVIRFSIQTAAEGRDQERPLHLVLLLDVSGSMARKDREEILHRAVGELVDHLQPTDRVSVVSFAREGELVLEGASGADGERILDTVKRLRHQGGTHLESGLTLAYEVARGQYSPEANNRVVLLTDGAANLGPVLPEKFRQMAEENRRAGIYLDCFGVGLDGFNDEMLEALSRYGEGRYAFLETPEEVEESFTRRLAGALRPGAKDVRVQVEFNPERVRRYRQIGYERHQMRAEDFRDDRVSAATVGHREAGNALYLVEVIEDGDGPLGHVFYRYRRPGEETFREAQWPLAYRSQRPSLEEAPEALRVGMAAAFLAEKMAGHPQSEGLDWRDLRSWVADLMGPLAEDPTVRSLREMIEQAERLAPAPP